MTDQSPVMDLLKHGVPLALLVDLAGFGGTSEDAYREERRLGEPAPVFGRLVAVAS